MTTSNKNQSTTSNFYVEIKGKSGELNYDPNPVEADLNDPRFWDEDFVRMPFSTKSLFPQSVKNNTLVKRWSLIYEAMELDLKSIEDLKNVIQRYNHTHDFNFKVLDFYKSKHPDEFDNHIVITFPTMMSTIQDMNYILTQPIKLMKAGSGPEEVTFTSKQVTCILSAAFFCCFPGRNSSKLACSAEYFSYPAFTFKNLFAAQNPTETTTKCEILRCILNYLFDNLTTGSYASERLIRYTKSVLPASEVFSSNENHTDKSFFDKIFDMAATQQLSEVTFSSEPIEQSAGDAIMAVFANRYIGETLIMGGVAQEELVICRSPELLCASLFVQKLSLQETIRVTGAETCNTISGSGNSFSFVGSSLQKANVVNGFANTDHVFLDAFNYNQSTADQYTTPFLFRELDKFLSAVRPSTSESLQLIPFSTGAWGCGVFGGDIHLKFYIQWLGCSMKNRKMVMSTFLMKNTKANELKNFYTEISNMKPNLHIAMCALLKTKLEEGDVLDTLQSYIENHV